MFSSCIDMLCAYCDNNGPLSSHRFSSLLKAVDCLSNIVIDSVENCEAACKCARASTQE